MIENLMIQQEGKEICIQVIRSGRRSMGLEVRSADMVFARIPNKLPDRELKKFVEDHRKWILEKTNLAEKREEVRLSTKAMPLDKLTTEEVQRIKEKIAERVEHFSRIMGVSVNRITIKNQRTRWGSCSARGNLNFNYQLYYLPDELLDYVVIHELAHRKHMNHSKEFWAEVEKYCPEYKACRKRLKEYMLV